jgi:hypothetical protein
MEESIYPRTVLNYSPKGKGWSRECWWNQSWNGEPRCNKIEVWVWFMWMSGDLRDLGAVANVGKNLFITLCVCVITFSAESRVQYFAAFCVIFDAQFGV